ncbi:major facilitator transporter [Burkholderia lata]|uniref:Major facilitator transporter n=1 Tax=Burkholderia lata (strain ATCC 17760 / DSM 23089 / LMG 22485 / NCIMB 9086 / R18194 / 383) TaxID=482957 RepID=A0A6P2T529_BURL3|nr:MFS transporter [Burkholderia lata]VWC51144.1 major facilitator transporter [Burkholderia lata]
MGKEQGITGYPSLARARFAQIVVAAIGLFAAVDITVVGLLIEPMKHELGLTDVQVGLVHTTSFFAAYGLFAIPMGMLADRCRRVRLMLVAMVLWCAGLMLVGLSHDRWLLAAAKAVMGLALALTYPAAMSLMADNFAPDRRAFASATFGVGQDLGGGAGLLVGGIGYSALVGMVALNPHALGGISPWRAVSLIFAAFGLLLIPAILALREPARMEMRSTGSSGSFRALWNYRRFLIPLFVGMMALGGLVSGLRTWCAPALMRLYELQPGDFASWLSAVMLISGLAGHLLSSRLVNMARGRGGDQTAMLLAAIAAVLCIPGSFLATTSDTWGFAALMSLFMVASGVAVSIPVIVINFRIPNELRGLCMGLYVVLISLSGMIGAPLIGYANQRLGGDATLGEAMALVGGPFALLAALSFWVATWSWAAAPPIAHDAQNEMPAP